MSDASFPEELISAFLDDELSPSERQHVESKLADHPEMRQVLADLQEQSQAIQDLPKYQLGNDFADRLMKHAAFDSKSTVGHLNEATDA